MAEDKRERGEVLSEVFERLEGKWPPVAPEPEVEPSEDWAKADDPLRKGPITEFLEKREQHGA
jgi:hypothetical protein